MILTMWLGVVALIVTVLWFCVPMMIRVFQVRSLVRTCRRHHAIVLTYDDGPGDVLTHKLFELLQAEHVRATFFLLGRRAEASRERVRALHDAGHEIAMHSYWHHHAWKTLPWKTPLDYLRGKQFLHEELPDKPLFRPPYGKWTLPTLVLTLFHRVQIGWWTHDSGDTWTPMSSEPDAVAQSLIQSGGGVLLLHDFDRKTDDASDRATFVLETTQAVIEQARHHDMQLCTLSELLAMPNKVQIA